MRDILLTTILLVSAVGASISEAEAYPKDSSSLAAWQQSLLDGETLKNCLLERIWGDNDVVYKEWTPWDLAIWFREEAGDLPDERVHAALTDIYREAEAREGKESRELMTRAALWLGVCSDDATKAFLLEAAADTSKDGFLRTTALSSYLRNADAEEAKAALIHFLVTPNRIDNDMDRSEIYTFAHTAWKESSPQKKLAICEALQVGLAHEPTHWVFCSGDGWLSAMSAAYARSKERLALLERMYATAVPDGCLFDKQSLVPQLDAARKLTTHTSVNTNLMTAMARDFNQPLPEEEGIALETPPDAPGTARTVEKSPRVGQLGRYALGGAAAAILAAVGVWVFRRRRGASRP